MIMIWNRKEVFVGSSMKKCSEIRDSLSINNINYSYKVVNRNNSTFMGSNRANTGTFGEKTEFAYEYYIYVHKDDYNTANAIIHNMAI